MNVLFVCTGNTCRSPMAEGLCRPLNKEYKTDVLPLSAGLYAFAGAPVSQEAVLAVQSLADISNHKAREINEEYVEASDIIVAMTENHRQAIKQRFPNFAGRLVLLHELVGETDDVDDPYGLGQAAYTACSADIYRCLKDGWSSLLGNK